MKNRFVGTVAGAVSLICVCWGCEVYNVESRSRWYDVYGKLGVRGFVVGLFYGMHYVYKQRWLLRFPIIQRPPFFSFKLGLPLAVGQALKFSAAGYLLSGVLAFFLPNGYTSQDTMGKFMSEQIIFYIGSFVVILCWELSHHLHQVIHTKRFVFAPPKGSAAAETNPSEALLDTLEESTTKSLLQYLAYLDLCMVCESNVDTWRRAAFFEETGETYKRVIAVCLRPLEQLTVKLNESLDTPSIDNSSHLSSQLYLPAKGPEYSKLCESIYDTQVCARIVSSLTARSHKEDRFGIAQLSGSNAAVISIVLSCLLAVETLMGKKTNLQSPNHLMVPAGINWATISTERRDSTVGATGKRRNSPFYAKAYEIAGILRSSIYCIVSAFHNEMLNSSKAGHLEKDWIVSGKPLYGTHELLLQKLRLFLDYQA
ncbi:nuclear pore complex NDC1a [Olea europaea subsp. europaea]|uniref:Nuclear pore complex NDC1a n=3 Tax=Olea europaea subsp. europaea TaxID=158383 RepID=A0A8S0UJU0_OLEEU|nr:nuclear pore complex NDC1a [Olea europaea subsp. europaea]